MVVVCYFPLNSVHTKENLRMMSAQLVKVIKNCLVKNKVDVTNGCCCCAPDDSAQRVNRAPRRGWPPTDHQFTSRGPFITLSSALLCSCIPQLIFRAAIGQVTAMDRHSVGKQSRRSSL